MWEVRVAVGADPVSGHSRVRSFTVHGDRQAAEDAKVRWAAMAELLRSHGRAQPAISVAALLQEWLQADHGWRPSTICGYRSTARFLACDRVGSRRATDLTPRVLAAVCDQWRADGWPDPTIWARLRVMRSMMGWAYATRILDLNPLDGLRGPPQAKVRMHVPVEQVRSLLAFAAQRVVDAAESGTGNRPARLGVHHAEQILLLTRLAADSGARRGELAALQLGDLDGDVLTIARSTSNEVIGPTKSGRIRRLTLGPTTAGLWRDTVQRWRGRSTEPEFGPWLFSSATDHRTRLSTSGLGHWFATFCDDADLPDVTLHRLRHSVATALVSRGDILQAQYRLGHRDAATTLRIYSHVLPLTDADAAATLDRLYQS